MPNLVNPALAANWENWLRVFLMVAIGFTVVNLAQRHKNRKG